MSTLNFTDTLVIEHCCNCGMAFGIQQDFQTKLRNNGGSFYCPQGHAQHYTESEVQKLQKSLASEVKARQRVEESRDYWSKEYEAQCERTNHQERRARALKGVVTLTKKRIVKGACPCCSKTFADLKAHMAEKHPDYGPDESKST